MVKPEKDSRISKIDTYLNVAEVFAYRSTCLKRKYGAVIVKDDAVISTGYNGSPRGMENCCDRKECPRIRLGLHQGQGYGICRAVHAEQNALLNCSREQTIGADLYLVEFYSPCKALSVMCEVDHTGGNTECDHASWG